MCAKNIVHVVVAHVEVVSEDMYQQLMAILSRTGIAERVPKVIMCIEQLLINADI